MGFVDEFNRGKQEAWLPERAGATPAELEGRRVAGATVSGAPADGGGGGSIVGIAILIYGLLLMAGGVIVAVLALVGTPILFALSCLGAKRPEPLKWGRTYLTMCIGVAFALLAGLAATGLARSLEQYPPPSAQDFASMWPRFLACHYAWPSLLVTEACALLLFSVVVQYRLRPAFSGAIGFLKALCASVISVSAILGPILIFLGTGEQPVAPMSGAMYPQVTPRHVSHSDPSR